MFEMWHVVVAYVVIASNRSTIPLVLDKAATITGIEELR